MKLRTYVNALFTLCVGAFLNVAMPTHADQIANEPLRCELSMHKNSLRITLKNRSSQTWSVMRRGTPLEGFLGDHLNVERDGERVDYIGPMVKRAAPTATEYWIIPPKRSRTISLPLAKGYDLSKRGLYTIHWSGAVSDARGVHVTSYDDTALQSHTLKCASVSHKH